MVMVVVVIGVMVMVIFVIGLTPLKDNCKCPRCLQRNRNIMLRCNALQQHMQQTVLALPRRGCCAGVSHRPPRLIRLLVRRRFVMFSGASPTLTNFKNDDLRRVLQPHPQH